MDVIQPRELPQHSMWCRNRRALASAGCGGESCLCFPRCASGCMLPGCGAANRSHGASSATCAPPCLKEEGVKALILLLTTFCLTPELQRREGRPHSVWLTAASQGMDTVPLQILGERRDCLGAQERVCTCLSVSGHGRACLLTT